MTIDGIDLGDLISPKYSRVKEEGKPFGGRLLHNPDDVYDHNAWDHVEWNHEQEEEAQKIIQKQQSKMVPLSEKIEHDEKANEYWDRFYSWHTNNFFKDRNWFENEFPQLFATSDLKILEVGCGVGNSVFPILQKHKHEPDFHIYCCDFSKNAIELVKNHADYRSEKCTAFVYDLTSDEEIKEIPENSLDFISMIFVLSAISPEKQKKVFMKLFKLLKPGGKILFRDYGRYDLAQLRFKEGRMLDDHFYLRGDGTQVYFFTQEELNDLATSSGFQVEQNAIDRRLLVNRLRKLKMYRVWIQCQFTKPMQP